MKRAAVSRSGDSNSAGSSVTDGAPAAGVSSPRDPGFGVTTPRRCTEDPVLNKRLGMYQRPVSAHGVRNQQGR